MLPCLNEQAYTALEKKNITCVRSDIRLGKKSDDFIFNTLEMISYLIRKVMISYLIY